jgi:hypothetical protein
MRNVLQSAGLNERIQKIKNIRECGKQVATALRNTWICKWNFEKPIIRVLSHEKQTQHFSVHQSMIILVKTNAELKKGKVFHSR